MIMADNFAGPSQVKEHCKGKSSQSGEKQTVLYVLTSL